MSPCPRIQSTAVSGYLIRECAVVSKLEGSDVNNINIRLPSGDSRDLRITVLDQNSNVVDISGFVAIFEMDGHGTHVEKTSGNGITVINAIRGEIVVNFAMGDTMNLEPNTMYRFSVKLWQGEKQYTVLLGDIFVL